MTKTPTRKYQPTHFFSWLNLSSKHSPRLPAVLKLPLFVGAVFLIGISVFGFFQLIQYARWSRANQSPISFSDLGSADWCSSSLQRVLNSQLFTDTLGTLSASLLELNDCGALVSLPSLTVWQAGKQRYWQALGADSYLPVGVTNAWTITPDETDSAGKSVYALNSLGAAEILLADSSADVIPTVKLAINTACVRGLGTSSDPYEIVDNSFCTDAPLPSTPTPVPSPSATPTPTPSPSATPTPTPTPATPWPQPPYHPHPHPPTPIPTPLPPPATIAPIASIPVIAATGAFDDVGFSQPVNPYFSRLGGHDILFPDGYGLLKMFSASKATLNSIASWGQRVLSWVLLLVLLPLALLLAFYPLPRGKALADTTIEVFQNTVLLATRLSNRRGYYWGFHLPLAKYEVFATRANTIYHSPREIANTAWHHNFAPVWQLVRPAGRTTLLSPLVKLLNLIANGAPVIFGFTLILSFVYLTPLGLLVIGSHLPWMIRRLILNTRFNKPHAHV